MTGELAKDLGNEWPVIILGSGRCGSTLLQSVLNANPKFLIWGEHNGFLRHIADAYYGTREPVMVSNSRNRGFIADRVARLRSLAHWGAWENPSEPGELQEKFKSFIRSIFSPAMGNVIHWGFKEIRYGQNAADRTLPFLRECFPNARFLITIRNPRDTIFSMVASWHRDYGLNGPLVDRQLVRRARLWSAQYKNLYCFHRISMECSKIISFERLVRHEESSGLWSFLGADEPEGSCKAINFVKDQCKKSDSFGKLIDSRMRILGEQLAEVTHETRMLYGYSTYSI